MDLYTVADSSRFCSIRFASPRTIAGRLSGSSMHSAQIASGVRARTRLGRLQTAQSPVCPASDTAAHEAQANCPRSVGAYVRPHTLHLLVAPLRNMIFRWRRQAPQYLVFLFLTLTSTPQLSQLICFTRNQRTRVRQLPPPRATSRGAASDLRFRPCSCCSVPRGCRECDPGASG